MWTLIVECWFYITFPFLLWIGLVTKKVFHVFGAIILVSLAAKLFNFGGLTLLYYDHFILGALVFAWMKYDAVPKLLKSKYIGFVGLALIIITVVTPYPGSRNLLWYFQSLCACSGAALIILYHRLFGVNFSMPVASYLGKISYSMYLVHAVVLDAFIKLKLTSNIPLFLIVVIALSSATYYYVEQPVIKLIHRKVWFK